MRRKSGCPSKRTPKRSKISRSCQFAVGHTKVTDRTTGSLAGALACFDAVAETLGVVRVNTLDEMVETIDYFAHAAPPRGPRLGALTFSGGLKGLMLESVTRNGLAFPALAALIAKLGPQ